METTTTQPRTVEHAGEQVPVTHVQHGVYIRALNHEQQPPADLLSSTTVAVARLPWRLGEQRCWLVCERWRGRHYVEYRVGKHSAESGRGNGSYFPDDPARAMERYHELLAEAWSDLEPLD